MRLDLSHIQRWIAPGSRVLDLGCGDGVFLEFLRDQRNVRGTGLEIDQKYITAAIARGINVVEQNMDEGLANFPDQSFDTVVLALALQEFEPAPFPVSLVYSTQRRLPLKLRAFLDFAAPRLRERLQSAD